MTLFEMQNLVPELVLKATEELARRRTANDPRADEWLQIREALELADVHLRRIAERPDDALTLVDVARIYDPSSYVEENISRINCTRVANGESPIRKVELNPIEMHRVALRMAPQGRTWSPTRGFELFTPGGPVEVRGNFDVGEYEPRFFA